MLHMWPQRDTLTSFQYVLTFILQYLQVRYLQTKSSSSLLALGSVLQDFNILRWIEKDIAGLWIQFAGLCQKEILRFSDT